MSRALVATAITAAIAAMIAALLPALGCSRAVPDPAPAPSAKSTTPAMSSTAATASPPPSIPPAEGAALDPEVTAVEGDASFRLWIFAIPLADARLRVLDLAMGRDLAGARASSGASLVVNGGFFDRRDQPEGLVISEGALLSPRSDSLGGGVLSITGGQGRLAAAEGFVPTPDLGFALQAKPRLVVSSAAHVQRDDGRTAERTALCLRRGGRTLEIVVARGEAPGRGPTLSLLSDMLASRGCEEALNLDGGPSTGVAWRGRDRAQDLPPRGPLRHGIAVWIGE